MSTFILLYLYTARKLVIGNLSAYLTLEWWFLLSYPSGFYSHVSHITTSYHAIPPTTATDIGRQSHRPVLYCLPFINCAFQNSILLTLSKKRPIQCKVYSKSKVWYHYKIKFNTVLLTCARNIVYFMFNTFFVAINIHLFIYLFYLESVV